ncbi:MAG: carboxypeptidase-like regulatory domain-containing protein, partial [Chloroflexota bacterium]|nr:carboxypeptidase-like regulatory domain-containing protein [Chloroflexota bacterium]
TDRVTPALPQGGRWYWRVQSVRPQESSVFSASYHFDLLESSSVYVLNDFETPVDASVQEASNNWFGRWDSWPHQSITMTRTDAYGVTSGTYAGAATYTGACLYTPCKAGLAQFPNGLNFTPHDWSAYDYLAYDIYNPSMDDATAEVSVFSPLRESGYYLWERFPILGGTQSHLVFDLNHPFHAGPRDNITNFAIELVYPVQGFTLYYDNVRLVDLRADAVPPAPVEFSASDTGLGAAVDLDWHGYRPASDVIAYRVYVGNAAGCDIGPGRSSPVVTLDASVLRYRARTSTPASSTTAATPLYRDHAYCFTVTAVDRWGNESSPARIASLSVSWQKLVYPAYPAFQGHVLDVWGTPLDGAVVTATSAARAFSATTDPDGRFAIDPPTGVYTLTATLPPYRGSLSSPAMNVTTTTYQTWDLVLRSTADLLVNGDFEGAWTDAWSVMATQAGAPTQVTSSRRSGQASLKLGGLAAVGESSVAQTLAASHLCNPMVSFWYRVEGSDAADRLAAIIQNGAADQQLGEVPLSGTDWTYQRFPWTGELTGTLKLVLAVSENGVAPTTVYLDDVSLLPGACHSVFLPMLSRN